MIRKTKLIAAALVALGSVAASSPAQANHGTGSSPVVGYIYITQIGTAPVPTYQLFGALGNSMLWTCVPASTATSYSVSCVPASNAVNLVWHCDVLHADIAILSAGGAGHTSLDCDGLNPPEAQTAYLTGGPAYDWAWAASTMPVKKFTCTVDARKLGVVTAPIPDFRAGCGDPGLVKVYTD